MRILYTLLAAILILAACNKPGNQTPAEPPTTEDTTPITQPVLKDSTIKITGIDSFVEMTYFDSISIPITISRDTGTVQDVTLSISGLPMRVKAKFEQTSGKTPFTTTLKLYTYMVPMNVISNDVITITADLTNGQNIKHHFKLRELLKFWEHYVTMDFFNFHDKNYGGPTFNFVPSTEQLYLTNVYLGVHNGKTYYSIDDQIDITNNMMSTTGHPRYIKFPDTYKIKGYSSGDTVVFNVRMPQIELYLKDRERQFLLWYGVYTDSTGVFDRETINIYGELLFDF